VDVFNRKPAYRCLKPDEEFTWRIDLFRWWVVFGGERWGDPVAFELQPGRYRLQAQYSDNPRRARADCAAMLGTSVSNRAEFTVGPDS
jgi:hypothetical protein